MMNCRCWLACLLTFVLLPAVEAQVQIDLRLGSETVLLYESIPVEVRLRNVSSRTLVFGGDRDSAAPWLSFFVTDESGRVVPTIAPLPSGEPLFLRPG